MSLRNEIGELILQFAYSDGAIRELHPTTKKHLEETIDSILELLK